MELLYLWIEEYNVFKHKDINFGGDVKFRKEDIDENENILKLNYEKNNNDMKDILNFMSEDNEKSNYKNIVNITGVVGQNGAGKTMLLTYLLNRLANSSNSKTSKDNDRFCIIFKDDEEYKFHCNFESVTCKGLKLNKVISLKGGRHLLPVIFSNSFMRRSPSSSGVDNFRELSTNRLITGYSNEVSFVGDIQSEMKEITKFELEETINEVELLSRINRENNLEISNVGQKGDRLGKLIEYIICLKN